MISSKATKKINKITKSWDKRTIRDLEQVRLKQAHVFIWIVVVKNNFDQVNVTFLISHLASTLSFWLTNIGKQM